MVMLLPKQAIFISIKKKRLAWFAARSAFQKRAAAILSLIDDALNGSLIRDQKLLVNVGDRPLKKGLFQPFRVYGPAEAPGYADVAAPDFVFGGWPEAGISDFDPACSAMTTAGHQPPETGLLGWYGNAANIPARQLLLQKAKAHPDLIEAVDTGDWFKRSERIGTSKTLLSMPGQVKRYRFLIDIEGVGYSGRLKILLHSKRVLFVQERPWREWYFSLMRPWEHYVPVAADLSDLDKNLEIVLADEGLEKRIAGAALDFAGAFLTRKYAVETWRRALEGVN